MKRLMTYLGSAALLVGMIAGPAIPATADVNEAPDDGVEVRIGTSLEDSVLLGSAGEEPEASVFSIPFNPVDVAQCNVLNNAEHVLTTIDSWPYTNGSLTIWSGGDIDLECGTEDTSGFKHIRDRHQFASWNHPNGWETVRASASAALGYESPQTWDEFMIHAVEDTLDYSMPTPVVNYANDTVCFSAPFNIFVGGSIYASYYANTVVSRSNYTFVTAYLSDISYASACV